MKLLIALSMIAVAFVPVAAASGGASAGVSSYGYGDCATATSAYNSNSAGAGASSSSVGFVSASASTYCQAYQDWWTGQIIRYSAIGASAGTCNIATGCVFVGASWVTSGAYCNMYATGAGNLGCPLGPAPFVPALIP